VNIPSSEKKIVFQMPNLSERNPTSVRGVVLPQLEQVKRILNGSQLVFIVSGLGGNIGSGIAPLVAKCAKQLHAMAVGIVVMPFIFEKHKYFFAGCALRQLSENCEGIIHLKNETLLEIEQLSAVDASARLYERLSLAINTLVKPIEKDGIGDGVENVVDYIKANPYLTLHAADEEDPAETVSHTSTPSGFLVSYQSREEVDAIISSYDPIDECLRRSSVDNLDPDLDSSLQLGQGILRNIEA